MKIATTILFFLSINLCFAQETFVRKYTTYVTKTDGKISEWKEIDLTVVFNEKHTNNVVLYYPAKAKTLYKIGNIEKDKTVNGSEYQVIECIDEEGVKVTLQLFSDVMRLFVGSGYIEFHE